MNVKHLNLKVIHSALGINQMVKKYVIHILNNIYNHSNMILN